MAKAKNDSRIVTGGFESRFVLELVVLMSTLSRREIAQRYGISLTLVNEIMRFENYYQRT